MEKWAKYEFNDKEQFDTKVENLTANYIAIVRLGNIVLEEGSDKQEAVLSNKYHADIMWLDIEDHPYGWKSYAVAVTDGNGVHSFFGIDYQTNKL
tara:strand:+ start:2088 stop:2372 length:285 start_codon:yes stop_codon:yes gene_type:complete